MRIINADSRWEEVKFYTPKELAREIPIGEHKLRRLAREYESFPVIRNGNRLLLIKPEVEAWLIEMAKAGVRI